MREMEYSRWNKGFGMIETLLVIVIIMVGLAPLIDFSLHLGRQASQASDLSNIDAFRRNFPRLIADNSAWSATIAKNGGAMACLSNGQGASCPPSSQRNVFDLYDGSSNLVYNSTDSRNGITLSGIPCGPNGIAPYNSSSYDYNKSVNCPLQYRLEWVAMTKDPYPIVAVIATLVMTSSYLPRGFIINPDLYSYTIPYVNGVQTLPPKPGEWPTTLIYRTAF